MIGFSCAAAANPRMAKGNSTMAMGSSRTDPSEPGSRMVQPGLRREVEHQSINAIEAYKEKAENSPSDVMSKVHL